MKTLVCVGICIKMYLFFSMYKIISFIKLVAFQTARMHDARHRKERNICDTFCALLEKKKDMPGIPVQCVLICTLYAHSGQTEYNKKRGFSQCILFYFITTFEKCVT